jgi:hypothetical protein
MPDILDFPNNDVAMLTRLIRPDRADLSVNAAKFILKIEFEQADHDRMRTLSQKANAGILTPAEQAELDDYERVGCLIDLLHSKARKTLKKHASGR